MNLLEKAIATALMAHAGATDKAGAPYLLHPLRLMLQMTTEDEMITAVLHDVIEDSDVSLDFLASEGFSQEVLEALALLTRDDSQHYLDYVAAIAVNPLARRVKLADLEDNMDIRRLPSELTSKDFQRLEKYRLAWELLAADDWPRRV